MQVYIEISKCIFRFREIFAYDIRKTKKSRKQKFPAVNLGVAQH